MISGTGRHFVESGFTLRQFEVSRFLDWSVPIHSGVGLQLTGLTRLHTLAVNGWVMQQLSGIRMSKRKALFLGGIGGVAVFAMWLVWGFDRGGSDEAKYERWQGLTRTCGRLESVKQWLPVRVSQFIHLSDLRYHEKLKCELLRIELLTSGYLTNVSFEVTNFAVAGPRIMRGFSKVKVEAGTRGMSFQTFQLPSAGRRELVTVTCRAQDLVLLGQIVSGDSNVPAKPVREPSLHYEGDAPNSAPLLRPQTLPR